MREVACPWVCDNIGWFDMETDVTRPKLTATGASDERATRAPPRHHILLVEDDDGIADEVAAELEARGYSVSRVADGEAAIERAMQGDYNLLVVDRMLPGLDGIAVIQRLREENLRVPVLVMSALSAVDERVRGLKAGGDDYLTKPFALPELAARVEALLRRPAETRETALRAGDLVLDLIDREAHRNGRAIELLPREYKLLEYLMRRQDQVVTRAMLLEDVWHYRFVPQTNLVDVHMGKLRRKLCAPGEPDPIESVWGSGFMLRASD
jgi:two-component system OmpR family response regulator